MEAMRKLLEKSIRQFGDPNVDYDFEVLPDGQDQITGLPAVRVIALNEATKKLFLWLKEKVEVDGGND